MTVTAPEAPVRAELAHRHLVDDQLWNRLVGRIVKDEGVDRSTAERIMDQALAFLQLCAQVSDGHFSPSKLVDTGWHTFILYTAEYAKFCERVAGRFIHHDPSDKPGVDYGKGNAARTVAAMRTAGLAVDEMLWVAAGDCNNSCKCNSENVCVGGFASKQPTKAECQGSCSDTPRCGPNGPDCTPISTLQALAGAVANCSGDCDADDTGGDLSVSPAAQASDCDSTPRCTPGGPPCTVAIANRPRALAAVGADCSGYCSGDSCSGGGGDGDSGCSH